MRTNLRKDRHATIPADPAAENEDSDDHRRNGQKRPGEQWRRLATGMHDTRLYHVAANLSGGVFWQAEVRLNDKWVWNRFASELHARAWLWMATQPPTELSAVEREEVNRPCSTPCFAMDE